jgi:hypothetical protein
MAKFTQGVQKAINPIDIYSIISLEAGIFGWILGALIIWIGFSPPPNFFHFDQSFYNFLVLLPGLCWLTAIITGIIALKQIKRKSHQKGAGLAKSGIIIGGIGCALFYGLILVGVVGFYMLISKGYIGFLLHSGSVPF